MSITSQVETSGGEQPSTLQSSARQYKYALRDIRRNVDEYKRRLSGDLAGLVESMPDTSQLTEALIGARRALNDLMAARFPGKSLTSYGGANGPVPPPEVWLGEAHARIEELKVKRVPLTQGGRDRDWQQFSSQYFALESHFATIVDDVYRNAHGQALNAIDRWSKQQPGPQYFFPDSPIFPTAEAPTDLLVETLPHVQPGHGPMWFSIGASVATTEVGLKIASGDRKSVDSRQLTVGAAAIPATIDLDLAAGMRTSSPLMAERLILNVLTSLPADQLFIRVFDPVRLGDSAAFLYGLDKAAETKDGPVKIAERVIGDKVMTTDREIDDLLRDMEEHITRVTQKYLQGEHQTLTEYNNAAKMVTEPYRMLVLYNFPHGFKRQDNLDLDRLERLAKIIEGGPRAGLYTIIVSDEVSLTEFVEYGDSWNRQVAEKDHMRYIKRLPFFGDGAILDEHGLTTLVGLDVTDAKLEVPRMTNRSGSGIEGESHFVCLGPGQVHLRWAPVVLFDESEQPQRRDEMLRRVGANFTASTGTVIRPGWVADLDRRDTAANPYRPDTWWRTSTRQGADARIGQLGATGVAKLSFTSESGGVGALIGGRPGAGKSVLIHALIMSLAVEYSPAELEMYLIDFKEGVEFKCYADAGLPHALAVAIEAEREFGIAVLESMVREIGRRGERFKEQGKSKLDDYRAATNEVMPRQIVIIDEFQKLFERDDRLAQQASFLIEKVLREGRAFGLHLVLASQTIQGMQGLDRHVLNLVPTRVALQMSMQDSELILGEGNVAAKDLNRKGEGIINTKQGNPDANERFQATLWHTAGDNGQASDQEQVLRVLRARADRDGLTNRPRVFAGSDPALLDGSVFGSGYPLGTPASLDPALSFELRREGGANLLVVNNSMGPLIAVLAAAARNGIRVRMLDFLTNHDEWEPLREQFAARDGFTAVSRRGVDDALAEVGAMVGERVEFEEYKSPTELLVIVGLHRARDFDADDSYNDEGPLAKLTTILRDGPEVGVHTLCWVDRAGMISRRLSTQATREFGLRLVGSSSMEDSQTLLDGDAAATMKPNQAIFDDHERGTAVRVITYGTPAPDELREVLA